GTPVNVPQDAPSIQAGLNAACSGDTVYVSAGTYYENLTVPKINLTLKGAPGTSPESVVIDSNALGSVITVGNAGFDVEGLTLRGAISSSGFSGAGLFVNGAYNSGGIYYSQYGMNVTARNLVIKNNSTGILIVNVSMGTISLERNLIISNGTGIDTSNYGSSVLNMTNNTVANNTGSYGGYTDWAGSGSHIFRNNIFANNSYGIGSNRYTPKMILYNDVWNNTGGNYMDSAISGYFPAASDAGAFTPSPGTGSLMVDPKFISSTDYHLQATSPVINAGDPSSQSDPDGSRADMGAYPFAGTLPSVDITPPTISGVTASNITQASSTVSWTTNENTDSQVEYGLTTSYGSTSALNAALVTSHSVNLSELTAGTVYHYRVKSKDAAGNVATSEDQSFTTTVATPFASVPAPLSMRWNWFGRIMSPDTVQNYQLIISYSPHAIDAPASFNIYLKKPGESGFTKTNYPKSSLTKYVASSGGEASYSAYPLGSYGVPSDSIPLGEYKVYATAVDNAGIETAPTPTATGNYNPAPLITNPAGGSTQSSLTQIDLSNRSSLANPRYTVYLFGASGYIWAPNAFYGNSVTYGGPALSSANNPHTLVASIFPSSIDPADSSPYTVSTFNIGGSATTTASAATLGKLASVLASLSQLMQQVAQLLSP
ncbi:MAG: fibronectin type III domain-containing protein, partial [Parcubacteria group bacterium]|nr:fibronectin type III domain-containing protein [Parcubacteria group bacterium]